MSFNLNDEQKINELQNWFQDCPNLPKSIDPLLLKRFYYCMFGVMEDVQKLIKHHFKLRNKNPEIFIDRDPKDISCQRTFEYADIILLHGLTPEYHKIICFRLCDFDANKVHHTEDTKTFFMLMDCRFITNDCADDANILATGEVQIFDMAGFTMKHLYKLSFTTLRTYVRFLQEAFPVRLKAVHMINCPTYLDKIVAVVKPFISAEVFKLIKFHTSGLDELYEHVPREMLPEEYGGEAGKISELKMQTIEALLEKRDYLVNPDYWRVDV